MSPDDSKPQDANRTENDSDPETPAVAFMRASELCDCDLDDVDDCDQEDVDDDREPLPEPEGISDAALAAAFEDREGSR